MVISFWFDFFVINIHSFFNCGGVALFNTITLLNYDLTPTSR